MHSSTTQFMQMMRTDYSRMCIITQKKPLLQLQTNEFNITRASCSCQGVAIMISPAAAIIQLRQLNHKHCLQHTQSTENGLFINLTG